MVGMQVGEEDCSQTIKWLRGFLVPPPELGLAQLLVDAVSGVHQVITVSDDNG